MLRTFQAPIYFVVGIVLLALVLRTWFVMGVIEPVTVAGSSMAPALRGSFAVATCPACESSFEVGAEFANQTDFGACPHCGLTSVPLDSLAIRRGDRLWIDRTVFERRQPRRWEVVVLRQPDQGDQLCVKRVVALPGETVRLSGGDVWVNGQPVAKSLAEQSALRRLVHRADGNPKRWTPAEGGNWQWVDGAWRRASETSPGFDWLRYRHVRQRPITDDVAYNAGISRQLELARDLMLSTVIQLQGEGDFALELADGCRQLLVTICTTDRSVTLAENGKQVLMQPLSTHAARRLSQGTVSLMFTNFDRQLLLVLDGQIELHYQLDEAPCRTGSGQPLAIGARRLDISLRELTVYRDTHYTAAPLGALEPKSPLQLGKDQYFVLGDNPPVSIDSRVWGPVPGRLLLGAPLGVR
ncbi:MAG: signal peptidase I [Planctomycetales bacterium]|nr:signal peptidase I [Planctomycetales bacterium]